MSASETVHQEIVIVRRHADHEEGHHGGVWKIAFADFMTAMMAFFLVMWLISASDKNREAIARYFNPLKLVDTTTRPKGLHDSKKDDASVEMPSSSTDPEAKPGKNEKPAKAEKPSKEDKPAKDDKSGQGEKHTKEDSAAARSEAKLFQDPYAALAEIVRGAPKDIGKPPGERSAEGAKGGESFRDPFAPPAPAPASAASDPDGEAEQPIQPRSAQALPPAKAAAATSRSEDADAEDTPSAPAAAAPIAANRSGKAPALGAQAAANAGDSAAAEALREQIAKAVAKSIGAAGAGPQIEVRKTAEGLLISLTDKADFSMFASGSAEPDRKLVLLMEGISRALQARPGPIVIRGHTDAHPFRSGAYDNWRLSADRAQMAHYMLVRGGLAEKRIQRIEGYADHQLKTPANPLGAQNRRIELLIREDRT